MIMKKCICNVCDICVYVINVTLCVCHACVYAAYSTLCTVVDILVTYIMINIAFFNESCRK